MSWSARWMYVCLSLALGACTSSSATDAFEGGGDAPPMGSSPGDSASCAVDADCQPAASTCCECPSFAIAAAGGFGDGCDEVNCDGLREENCSQLAEAVCIQGQCELSCLPVILGPDEVCDLGFERDELGCATTTCGTPDPNAEGCTVDEDCVRVDADCCGCEMGGEDTAVPASEADSFQSGLDCTGNEACPGVFVCERDVIPQCLGGACTLAPAMPPDTDPGAPTPCGLTELPPCPAGQVCVLNDPDSNDAGPFGVGVCRSQ